MISIATAAKAGATGVDIMVPAKFISNRKYDKLRDDIKNNMLACQENNLSVRYILEYRVFNHETLAKTCQIFKTLGIDYVFPSTGHMIDDIHDNLIASKYLMAKSQIKTIANGNIWTEKHAESVKLADIYGVRLHHIPSLELFLKNHSY
jgi:deoxyribose-phosphate aldolase